MSFSTYEREHFNMSIVSVMVRVLGNVRKAVLVSYGGVFRPVRRVLCVRVRLQLVVQCFDV